MASQRARGEFYEECKDAKGRPHPSINVGFWYNIKWTRRSNYEEDKIYIKAKHPSNPALDKWLTNSGKVFTPPRLERDNVSVKVTSFNKSASGITVEGWACSYKRNEKVNVSLVADTSEFKSNHLPVTYRDKDGQIGNSYMHVGINYGRGGCSKQLPFPELGYLCSYTDIDGENQSFQDLRDDVDRSHIQLASVAADRASTGAPSNCFDRDRTGFRIQITDFSTLFNISALYIDLPEGGSWVSTPSTQKHREAMILNSKLKLKVQSSHLPLYPRVVDLE
jgi:hypothetical protein